MIFKEYDDTDKAIKVLLMSAIDETYICVLQDRYVGYANVTTLEMLTHLYTKYARITPNKFQENNKKMKAPWKPNQLFETLVDQVTDGIEYMYAGNNEYSPGFLNDFPQCCVQHRNCCGRFQEVEEASRNGKNMG